MKQITIKTYNALADFALFTDEEREATVELINSCFQWFRIKRWIRNF